MARLSGSSGTVSGSVCGFSYSGVRPEKLMETEYTLVTVVMDRTGSVSGFEGELLSALRGAIGACAKSARADNILVRFMSFAEDVREEFGFTPVASVDDSLVKVPRCQGNTALRDALFAAVSGASAYGAQLDGADFRVNSVSFVITDGDDNASRTSAAEVAAELKRGLREEFLESSQCFLIGVNAGSCSRRLSDFADECGLDGYEDAGAATPAALARMAAFISRSVSSASVSLSAGVSQAAVV